MLQLKLPISLYLSGLNGRDKSRLSYIKKVRFIFWRVNQSQMVETKYFV